MRCLPALLMAALLVPGFCPFAVPAADEKNDRTLAKHELPKDPKAAVLTLDYQGGFGPPRKNNDPTLEIRADGTAIVGDPWGTQKRMETKFNEAQVQELLRFALDKNKFFELTSAGLAKEVQKAQQGGLRLAVADAATTVIKIHADGKQHEVKYYALGMIARQHPQVKGLQQLREIEQRLNRARAEINAGGSAGVAQLLKLANAQLKTDHPDVPALTAEHLQSAWNNATGNRTASFLRQTKADGKLVTTSVRITQPKDGEPRVSANVNVREVK